MAIFATKAWDEGPIRLGGKTGTATVNWILHTNDPDNDTREDAIIALYAAVDPFYFDLTLDSVQLSERLSDNLDEAHWAAAVVYSSPQVKEEKPLEPEEGDDVDQPGRWSIRSSGGATLTRTKSLECIEDTANILGWKWESDPATNPVVLKLIGLESNPEGNSGSNFGVGGVQVPTGSIEIVLTTVRNNASITSGSYLVNTAEYVAQQRVNNVAFLGFPKGSLQLRSMDAQQRSKPENEDPTTPNTQPWDITFIIAYEPPVVVDTDTLPAFSRAKEGHEYLDIMYVDQEVEVNVFPGALTLVMPVIHRMAIHRLYDYLDFKTALKLK